MPTVVKVRKWGNSLGLRLPKTFTSQHAIANGTSVELDSIKIVHGKPRRRSHYKLKDILRNYAKPPRRLDFAPKGREVV